MIREVLLCIDILRMFDSIFPSCSLNLRNTLEFFCTCQTECKKALGWLLLYNLAFFRHGSFTSMTHVFLRRKIRTTTCIIHIRRSMFVVKGKCICKQHSCIWSKSNAGTQPKAAYVRTYFVCILLILVCKLGASLSIFSHD